MTQREPPSLRSANKYRAPEFGGRPPVELSESGGEMTVTRESEIEAETCQVVVLTENMQRARKAQPQLVAVERHALHSLKDLR